jgi:dihydrodipicolinate synthase/N-acetylneuraminate lyase
VLDGVYAANVTPFRDDGRWTLDQGAYCAHVEWMVSQGVPGVAPFGTNGEGPSVTGEEKLGVLHELVARDIDVDLLPVLMEGNLPATLWLLERLQDLPVSGVLVLPPSYFRPVSDDGLRRFYDAVAKASQHPVLVYHIPQFGVPVPASVVASLPVWGVKNSAGDAAYSDAVRTAGRQVMVGTESDLAHDLVEGAGTISALANVVPTQMVEVHRRVRAGEPATALSDHLVEVSRLTKEHDPPGVLKVLAEAQSGIPMGTVRPPLTPPPASYDVQGALERLQAPTG